jgi:predicted amidohydrolase YtcJ
MAQRTVVINADLGPLRSGISAFSIEDGVFRAVVDQVDADQLTRPGDILIDAGHRTVLPAIDDSHLHAYEFGRSLTACDLRGVRTPAELASRLRTASPEANGWLRWCFASKDTARLHDGVARLKGWMERNDVQ